MAGCPNCPTHDVLAPLGGSTDSLTARQCRSVHNLVLCKHCHGGFDIRFLSRRDRRRDRSCFLIPGSLAKRFLVGNLSARFDSGGTFSYFPADSSADVGENRFGIVVF